MSKVYYLQTDYKNIDQNPKQVVKFLDNTELFSLIKPKDNVGIKIHFGEDKNKSYINPRHIKNLVEKVKRIGAKPFLFDTNTLYRGKRMNAIDHFNLAFFEHNFGRLNIPVFIADGIKSKDYIDVSLNGNHIKKAKLASMVQDIDFMLVLSHLTGHMLTGFGAAIKNIGMGCASRAGKMDQHCEVSPSVKHDICILCKKCMQVCPEAAISIKENKIYVDEDKCTGCAQCISECPKGALKIVWSENYSLLQERLIEYAKAVTNICKRIYYVNFAAFITKECDCMNKEKEGIVPDLGILASKDCVSLDKATVDLLNQRNNKDVFAEIFPDTKFHHQFEYAEAVDLGECAYRLEEVHL